MSRYKCGKCNKHYTFDQYIELKKIPLVPEDTDPKKQHGYTFVCPCGYVFHRDKWYLSDMIKIDTKIGKLNVRVSTVFLEMDHSFTPDKFIWYETMVFPERCKGIDIDCYYQERYSTKKEARKGHARVIKALKSGYYKIEPTEYLLVINIPNKIISEVM